MTPTCQTTRQSTMMMNPSRDHDAVMTYTRLPSAQTCRGSAERRSPAETTGSSPRQDDHLHTNRHQQLHDLTTTKSVLINLCLYSSFSLFFFVMVSVHFSAHAAHFLASIYKTTVHKLCLSAVKVTSMFTAHVHVYVNMVQHVDELRLHVT